MKDDAGHLLAPFDRMSAVHEHLRLHDGHKARLLTQRRVTSQRLRIHADAHGGRESVRNADDGPPLREAGAKAIVFLQPIAQAVQPFGDGLVRRAGQRLGPCIHLDAGDNTLLREYLGERDA